MKVSKKKIDVAISRLIKPEAIPFTFCGQRLFFSSEKWISHKSSNPYSESQNQSTVPECQSC